MMKSEASWVKTPNARLLYKTLKPEKGIEELMANSINALVQLEQVVMEETRFQWANSHIFFYFFEGPQTSDFEKTPIWVGGEVIGPPNEDSLERFGLHDLASGSCLQRPLEPGFFEMGLPELKKNYITLSEDFLAQDRGALAKTWRIQLDREGKSSGGQIQLFLE